MTIPSELNAFIEWLNQELDIIEEDSAVETATTQTKSAQRETKE